MPMLDIQFIRTHTDEVKKAVQDKRLVVDIDRLLAVDKERVKLLQEIEELQSLKNDLNDLMKQAKTSEERQALITKGKEIKASSEAKEPEYITVKRPYDALMAQVPTVPSADTPVGKSDQENVEVAVWGERRAFDFTPKTHIELGKDLDILDLERGTKVAGYRGYYLKNEGVLLAMGIMQYGLRKMVEKGYSPMIPPTMIKGFALFGSGYFAGEEYNSGVDNIYQVAFRRDPGRYAVATSDVWFQSVLSERDRYLWQGYQGYVPGARVHEDRTGRPGRSERGCLDRSPGRDESGCSRDASGAWSSISADPDLYW